MGGFPFIMPREFRGPAYQSQATSNASLCSLSKTLLVVFRFPVVLLVRAMAGPHICDNLIFAHSTTRVWRCFKTYSLPPSSCRTFFFSPSAWLEHPRRSRAIPATRHETSRPSGSEVSTFLFAHHWCNGPLPAAHGPPNSLDALNPKCDTVRGATWQYVNHVKPGQEPRQDQEHHPSRFVPHHGANFNNTHAIQPSEQDHAEWQKLLCRRKAAKAQ